jgi:hypothetical protein
MRLPALFGAALYFAAVYRIARRTVSGWPWILAAVAALTLNPIVLDFMVAARGYGMALALWMWAFSELLPLLSGQSPANRDLLRASIAVSLSVVANLVFLFPAALLAGVAVVLMLRMRAAAPVEKRARKSTLAARGPGVWRWFVLPIALCAVAFCLVAPIDVARSADFYAGSASVVESLRSLASISVLYARWARGMGALRDTVAFVLAPALVAAALVIGVRRKDMVVLTPALVAAGSGLLLAIGHAVTQMPLPMDRTGIYFPVLVMLAAVLLARDLGWRAWVPVLLVLGWFAAQFNVRTFYLWEYDADSRSIAERIATHRSSDAPESIRVGGSWKLEPSLNFYRVKNGWTWMAPIERGAITPGFPLYALTTEDAGAVTALHLKTVYVGPLSESVLAEAQ